ncbi:FemAB family XrtA/PEP-CTERM system-associated protein [Methanolobus sp. ZRKC3]|uniref:FemAB family XrtA/PEP-CTERM system-associated protein n=1 Tax=Methanolobus sp. ZRKC3 TaxID=3125786 RepID=UPI00324DC3BA
MNTKLEILKNVSENEWAEYILNHKNSTFFHQIGWKNIVENTYGYKPCNLSIWDEGKLKGVLPLFLIESKLFGKKLVSQPFTSYGGVCADSDFYTGKLLEAAKKLCIEEKCSYLELRNIIKNDISEESDKYVTSILELDSDPDILLKNTLKRNKRKSIYRCSKSDLEWKWTDKTKEFHNIYSHNMRRLGTPVHDERFFKNILKEFPDNSKVLVVYKDNLAVYSAFYLMYKDTIINSWSSVLEEYRKYYPTDFGIWNAIKWACENNYNYYDFGRSQINSANLDFKERWSAQTKQLHYQYYLNTAKSIPNITSESFKRKAFSKMWSSMPLKLTKVAGPGLRSNFP